MLAVAILAGLLADNIAYDGPVSTWIAFLIPAVVLSFPITIALAERRLGPAVWVTSLYPLVLLVCCLTVWGLFVLTSEPVRRIPTPLFVLPVSFIMVGGPIVGFIYLPLIFAMACWNVARGRISLRRGCLQLLIPVTAWLAAFAILWWGFGSLLAGLLR